MVQNRFARVQIGFAAKENCVSWKENEFVLAKNP